jgi:hypothetical protein
MSGTIILGTTLVELKRFERDFFHLIFKNIKLGKITALEKSAIGVFKTQS